MSDCQSRIEKLRIQRFDIAFCVVCLSRNEEEDAEASMKV